MSSQSRSSCLRLSSSNWLILSVVPLLTVISSVDGVMCTDKTSVAEGVEANLLPSIGALDSCGLAYQRKNITKLKTL